MEEEKKSCVPEIKIVTDGCLSHVYINGKEVEGVLSWKMKHDRNKCGEELPVLELEISACKTTIDTIAIMELPDIYKGLYVSASDLHKTGKFTDKELSELLGPDCSFESVS